MSKTLENASHKVLCSEQKLFSNNLDIIRLCLAITVIFSHSYPLATGSSGNYHEWFVVNLHTSDTGGGLAVDFFFVISGFLITMSWLRSQNMQDFLRRRILRIYPGYIVAMIVSLLIAILGVFPHAGAYLHSISPKEFLTQLLSLQNGVINTDKVFRNNPFPSVVNGSLWTIYYEFQCYLVTALVGVFGLFHFRKLALAIFSVLLFIFTVKVWHHTDIAHTYTRLGTFYLAGTLFYLYRDKIHANRPLFLTMLGVLIIGCVFSPLFLMVLPIAGSYVLFYLAFSPRIRLHNFAHRTDLSYGTYLYAFPIQQLLISRFHFHSPAFLFLSALPLTILCALFSWHYIEKPCLALKKKKIIDFDPALPAPANQIALDTQSAFASPIPTLAER